MNIRSRLLKLESAQNPPANANPCHGLAERMRQMSAEIARRELAGIPWEPPAGEPTPGSLAARMRARTELRLTDGLA